MNLPPRKRGGIRYAYDHLDEIEADLAADDHGPLALQEILLAGCPTVSVRTGASFVRHGETGVLVDRLPPGQQCVETEEDKRALAVFLDAIEQAQAMDRPDLWHRAAEEFDTERIAGQVLVSLGRSRKSARLTPPG